MWGRGGGKWFRKNRSTGDLATGTRRQAGGVGRGGRGGGGTTAQRGSVGRGRVFRKCWPTQRPEKKTPGKQSAVPIKSNPAQKLAPFTGISTARGGGGASATRRPRPRTRAKRTVKRRHVRLNTRGWERPWSEPRQSGWKTFSPTVDSTTYQSTSAFWRLVLGLILSREVYISAIRIQARAATPTK